jgi:hypothetical protein
MRNLPENLTLTFPPRSTRLEAGSTATLTVGYSRNIKKGPAPALIDAILELHHAHDGGLGIEFPVTLRFRAPQLMVEPGTLKPTGDTLTVLLTLTNTGDQFSRGDVQVAAKFWLPGGEVIPNDFEEVVSEGLGPGGSKEFAIRLPEDVRNARKFKLELVATERMTAEPYSSDVSIGEDGYCRPVCYDCPYDRSSGIILGDSWTSWSDWLYPRPAYVLYFQVSMGVALFLAGGYFLRKCSVASRR